MKKLTLSNSLSLYQAQKNSKILTPQPNPLYKWRLPPVKAVLDVFHFLNIEQDEALLCELFTRDGFGLLVYNDIYDELMVADESCMADICELVSNLSKDGSVLYRDKEFIESHIADFYVMRREKQSHRLCCTTPNQS